MERFIKEKASRRAFLTKGCLFLTSFGIYPGFFDSLSKKAWAKKDTLSLREAVFYKRLANNIVQCGVCFRGCILKGGREASAATKRILMAGSIIWSMGGPQQYMLTLLKKNRLSICFLEQIFFALR